MMLERPPCPALRPFVRSLWYAASATGAADAREHLLPTGEMHLVIRLSERGVRVFAGVDDTAGSRLSPALVAGLRDRFHVRGTGEASTSVGAQLRPGAAGALFGLEACELANRHVPLDALWGAAAAHAREQLQEAATPEKALDVFERVLLARVGRVRGVHPAIARALSDVDGAWRVAAAAAASGLSHRRFATLFERAVGFTPKRYARVLRFGDALRLRAGDPSRPWSAIAVDAGYSDQPHLQREFVAMAGMTPATYARRGVRAVHHVPIERART